jgi:hypothetical protein
MPKRGHPEKYRKAEKHLILGVLRVGKSPSSGNPLKFSQSTFKAYGAGPRNCPFII